MRCFLEFVSAPSVDSPATLMLLHFDDKRYLIGNIAEGTSRSCLQHGVPLRRITDFFITGQSKWSNFGGMLGLMLGMADAKKAAAASESLRQDDPSIHLHGPPNMNYTLATARRFIFRTGIPFGVSEYSDLDPSASPPHSWQDKNIKVWAMPLKPSSHAAPLSLGGRKRSFEDMKDGSAPPTKYGDANAAAIVSQMFNSAWSLDKMEEMKLSKVQPPATIFVRDPATKQISPYSGPLPADDPTVPDINVLVRYPWPGARTQLLPPTIPCDYSVSYLVRTHPVRGAFLREKAQKLKVRPGPDYGRLTKGETVKNEEGKDVTPDMVMEPMKPGSGFLVIDLPSPAYLDAFESRPELNDASIMADVQAFVWILGPDVIHYPGIDRIKKRFPGARHVVSAPELADGGNFLAGASRHASRNHFMDPQSFPSLVHDSKYLRDAEISEPSSTAEMERAMRGLNLNLEPEFAVDKSKISKNIKEPDLVRHLKEDLGFVPPNLVQKFENGDFLSTELPKELAEFADVEVLTLGTGSSHPSQYRNVSSTLIRVPGCGSYLLDAGEATMNTLRRIYTKAELDEVLRDLRMIWISHMHADHHLGLTSVIRAWYEAAHGSAPGPNDDASSASSADGLVLGVVSDEAMLHWLYEYSGAEDFGHSRILPLATRASPGFSSLLYIPSAGSTSANPGDTAAHLARLNLSSFAAVPVRHCKGAQAVTLTANNGFRFSYSGDCRPSAEFATIGRDSHLLVHEATFEDDMRGEALAKKHSTAGEALVVAQAMRARAVVLTHFSQRYPKMPLLGIQRPRSNSRNIPPPDTLNATVLETKEAGAADDDVDAAATDEMGPRPASRRPSSRMGRPTSPGRGGVNPSRLDEASIKRTISSAELRVVTAFDFMRMRLSNMPALEARQEDMRQVYESIEAGRARIQEAAARAVTERSEAALEAKRQARIAKQNSQSKQQKQDALTKKERQLAGKKRASSEEAERRSPSPGAHGGKAQSRPGTTDGAKRARGALSTAKLPVGEANQ